MKRLILLIPFLAFALFGGEAVNAQPAPGGAPNPVITEIMYNPPEANNDTLEFLEILNPSAIANIDLSGFYFSSGVEYTFPAGVILTPGEYVLISGDSVVFEEWYGMESFEWTGGTALSNDGEGIALRNSIGAIADTVFFDDTNAWADADATGYSLVLCDPTADNNLPENWTLSENPTGITVNSLPVFADPGAASTCSPTGISDDNVITTVVYPNPTNGEFRLQMESLSNTGLLSIHNSVGQLISTRTLAKGTSSVVVNEQLTSGYYIVSIDKGDAIERIKLTVK